MSKRKRNKILIIRSDDDDDYDYENTNHTLVTVDYADDPKIKIYNPNGEYYYRPIGFNSKFYED